MTDVGIAVLALTQGVSAFHNFLPPLTEVRKGSTDDTQFAGDVRMGEVASVALTVGIGAVVSALTGDPVPTYVAVIVSIGLVYLYETTLRANHPMERKSGFSLSGPHTVTEQSA
jgi:hypothetical protein